VPGEYGHSSSKVRGPSRGPKQKKLPFFGKGSLRQRKANLIGHILHKQLMVDLEEARRYWKLKEEAQDRNLWSTQFGAGYGPVARQNTI
jgi:hypothetical protein